MARATVNKPPGQTGKPAMNTLRACLLATAALLAGLTLTGNAAPAQSIRHAAHLGQPRAWADAGMAFQQGWDAPTMVRMPRLTFPAPN
jgi:hypothetical protein